MVTSDVSKGAGSVLSSTLTAGSTAGGASEDSTSTSLVAGSRGTTLEGNPASGSTEVTGDCTGAAGATTGVLTCLTALTTGAGAEGAKARADEVGARMPARPMRGC